jgi:hypothetical protein
MEPCISLQIQKQKTKQYPIRLLKYNNICIDENHNVITVINDVATTPTKLIETYRLISEEKDELERLYESYKIFQAAKSAYDAASETFWKSAVGAKLETILVPDPMCYDRGQLHIMIKTFESQLFKHILQIKNKTLDISGYNYIIAKYILVMYESDNIPLRFEPDFVLQTINERRLDEIPKLWTNKTVFQHKKIVDCVYVSGHVLPPYRLKDSALINHN